MTVSEELRTLARLFPRSRELAISREMLDRYEHEIVCIGRLTPVWVVDAAPALEYFDTITVQRLALHFRDRTLSVVEPR